MRMNGSDIIGVQYKSLGHVGHLRQVQDELDQFRGLGVRMVEIHAAEGRYPMISGQIDMCICVSLDGI